MKFLRRISSKQLALLCAAVIAVAGGGTALALAAASGGPVPPAKPLANAVHDALAAPEQQGVTAEISFTNHLVDGIDLRGSNPLLAGGQGRLWASRDGHFRLELQSNGGGGDAQIVSDGKSFWVYDGSSNTVYRGTLPADRAHGARKRESVPTVGRIQKLIAQVMKHATVSGPTPGDTAGEPSYTVRTSPRRNGGLVGALELAWDADHGTPLRAAVYAKGQSSPVLELKATSISFGPVDMSAFAVAPPAGAKSQSVSSHERTGAKGKKGHRKPVVGLARVQRKVGFQVAAPAALAGRKRTSVALLGRDGVAVTYGRGLNGIAVIEKSVKAGAAHDPLGNARLPTLSIGGATARELSTPLGTVLRFTRGTVSYTVLGSLPKRTVESAANGL